MKFYLPLIILLTTVSPNLEAATIDTLTANPYEITNLRLFNVSGPVAAINWTGSTVEFDRAIPQGPNFSLDGTVSLIANGAPVPPAPLLGTLHGNAVFSFVSNVAGIPVTFTGAFSPDFLSGSGRLDGIGRSDMTGFYGLRTIDAPITFVLMLSAVAAMALLTRPRKVR